MPMPRPLFSHNIKLRKPWRKKAIYQPLDSTSLEIRLLHIDTASIGRAGRIKCHLEHVSLLDEQTPVFYEAISWCWGDPQPAKEILLNGARCKVSTNAETVIRRLGFEQGHAVIWLDAVCIDQSNLAERSEQVAIMRHVYSRADRVLLWLGEDEEEESTAAALGAIDEVLAHCRAEIHNGEDFESTFWDSQGRVRWSDREIPHFDWPALDTFFSSTLFFRVWIVQEIVLSRQALCFRGSLSKSWDEVSLAAQWLDHCNYWREAYGGYNIDGLENAARIWRLVHRPYRLASLLIMSFQLQATLPLDKVYGMLGLLQKGAGDVSTKLRPDYHARFDVIYTAATRLAIDEGKGRSYQLDVLRFAQVLTPPAGADPDDFHTPSWVTRYDWTFDIIHSPTTTDSFGPGAANGLLATIHDHDPAHPSVLSVQGIIISNIIWRSNLFTAALVNEDADRLALATELITCRAAARSHNHHGAAIALSLTGRRNAANTDALDDEHFLATYRRCMAACEETETSPPPEPPLAAVDDFRLAMYQGSRNRVFFTTASGHIGLGPPDTQLDDAVCILFGAECPVVLREEGLGTWQFRGEAYVHGVMEGEYIRQLIDQGRLEAETRWFDIG